MVKSGLKEAPGNNVPRVSPYRLAAHLTSAFAIYSGLLWTLLTVQSGELIALAPGMKHGVTAMRYRVLPLVALIAVTAVSGAPPRNWTCHRRCLSDGHDVRDLCLGPPVDGLLCATRLRCLWRE